MVYDYGTQRRAQQQFIDTIDFRKGPLLYNHAPFELLIYAPLGVLSYRHAVVLWYSLNVVALFIVPLLLRGYVPLVQAELSYALLVPPFFLPVTSAIIQGQDSIVLLILFTLLFVCFSNGNEGLAGCTLALATFKPHLVVPLLLVMAVTRRWKVVLGFVSTCFALALVSVLLVGWHAALHFPAYLVQFNRLPADIAAAYPEKMPNLRGLTYSLLNSRLGSQTTQLMGLSLSVAAISLLVLFFWRRRTLCLLDLSLAVTVSMLASYHGNFHDLALLVLPFYIVANEIARKPLTKGSVTVAIGILALFIFPLFGMSALAICPALLIFAFGIFWELLEDRLAAPPTAAAIAGK
jgi:hypothetical protein